MKGMDAINLLTRRGLPAGSANKADTRPSAGDKSIRTEKARPVTMRESPRIEAHIPIER